MVWTNLTKMLSNLKPEYLIFSWRYLEVGYCSSLESETKQRTEHAYVWKEWMSVKQLLRPKKKKKSLNSLGPSSW